MPHRLLLLLLIALAPCAAAVGRSAEAEGWWNDGSTDPWSFGVIDGDGDGVFTPAEIGVAQAQFQTALKETRSSLLAAVDRDQSGKVSRFEAQEAKPRLEALIKQSRALALAIHDTSRDGTLDDGERKRLVAALVTVFSNNGTAAADTNKDRSLSADEVAAALARIVEGKGGLFVLCDRNNDGQISTPESKLAFDLLAVCAGIRPLP